MDIHPGKVGCRGFVGTSNSHQPASQAAESQWLRLKRNNPCWAPKQQVQEFCSRLRLDSGNRTTLLCSPMRGHTNEALKTNLAWDASLGMISTQLVASGEGE